MWYKQSQESNLSPEEWGISQGQVSDMLKRIRGILSGGLGSIPSGAKTEDYLTDDDIADLAQNEYEIYNRYLSNLPDNVDIYDIMQAYRSGLLPQQQVYRSRLQPFDMSDAGVINYSGLPWEPKEYQKLSEIELNRLMSVANQRVTKSNKKEVLEARYELFLASFKDPELCNRLGLKQSEVNKLLRSWSGIPASSIELERMLNKTSDLSVEWTGISNSAMISKNRVDVDDIDGFFESIEIGENAPEWYSELGDPVRRDILRAVLAIDTHIKYNDLRFRITDVLMDSRSANGLYSPKDRLIEIKNNYANTVAHEIGHYLDDKWARDLSGSDMAYLTESTINIDLVFGNNEKAKQFYKIFQEFVMDISDRSNISSSYYQRRAEVFARFVAYFVTWVNKKSGGRVWDESPYGDRFTESDCLRFIRILQMKSYLDAGEI